MIVCVFEVQFITMNPQADVVKKSYLRYKAVKVKGSAGLSVQGVGCV